VLARRAAWRRLEHEVRSVSLGDELRPGEHALLYVGGGQDREEALVARDLAAKGEALHEPSAGGGAVLAVCRNDGESGYERCRVGRALGTYLHGPAAHATGGVLARSERCGASSRQRRTRSRRPARGRAAAAPDARPAASCRLTRSGSFRAPDPKG